MSSASRDRWPLVAPVALLLIFLAHSWFGPDVFYHLSWGRDVVTHGLLSPARLPLMAQPLSANVYWLFQGALYLIYRAGGVWLGSLVFGLAWVIIAASWARQVSLARRGCFAPWLALIAIVGAQSRFEQRPEVLSYLLLTLLVGRAWSLDLTRPLTVATGALIFFTHAVWCNVHGYFALGPLILGAKIFATLARPMNRTRAVITRAGGLLLLALAGTVTSPFGWRTWETVATYAGLGAKINDLIQELAPPSLTLSSPPLAAYAIAVALTVALLVAEAFRRRDLFAAVLALAGLALAAQAVRNVPLLFLLSAPLWSGLPAGPRVLRTSAATLAAIVCVFIGARFVVGAYGNANGCLSTFGPKLEPASYPITAAEYLRDQGFRGRIFNDSYDGGYLEYQCPDATVTGDSYFSDAAVTREYLNAIREPEHLAALDRRFGFDAFLINVENLANYEALRHAPDLTLAHVSSHRALFTRGTSARSPAGRYYEGGDLHHWANAFGLASWIAIARHAGDVDRLLRILGDLDGAAAIPASVLASALAGPFPERRCAVTNAARALRTRAFADRTVSLEHLDQIFAREPSCAP